MALVSNPVGRWLSAMRAPFLVIALVVFGATAFSPKPALAIEPVQRIVSPGGIEALLIESHEVGLISMRISFRGGAVQDPADKPGVAYFTGYMFNEGAGDLSPQELTRRLTRLGSSFAGDASTESIQISLSAPSANRVEAFRLLKLAIASPRFDPEPMERARRSALASLAQEGLNPGSVAMRRLTELLYGPNRYAMPVKGTPDAVARISADDVRTYRQRVFARDTLRVAVAGDIDAPTLARLLDDLFAVLPAKANLQAVPAIRPASARQQSIEMDVPQTIVVFGNTAPLLNARQGLAASLFNQILSAQFTGRLFRVVREREGLVYSIATGRGRLEQSESFSGSFGAAPGNASRAMTLTMSEIARLVAEGPSEEELGDAKSAFRGGYYLGLGTSASLSALLMTMQEQGLPDSYLADFDALVAGITIDEVRAAAALVARPDAMVSVSVGKANEAQTSRLVP
jgi:zinc protease